MSTMRQLTASAENGDNLPPPEVIAQEIVEDLQAALNEFTAVAEALEAAKAARQEGVKAAHTPFMLYEHVPVPLWMR